MTLIHRELTLMFNIRFLVNSSLYLRVSDSGLQAAASGSSSMYSQAAAYTHWDEPEDNRRLEREPEQFSCHPERGTPKSCSLTASVTLVYSSRTEKQRSHSATFCCNSAAAADAPRADTVSL